jgi:hypothetical protein
MRSAPRIDFDSSISRRAQISAHLRVLRCHARDIGWHLRAAAWSIPGLLRALLGR